MSGFLLLLESGPCMGSYTTKRAPNTLRAVRGRGGALDVLDLLDDQPRDDEELFVYTRREDRHGHLCTRGRGCFSTVSYRYVGELDRATGEVRTLTARDYALWQEQADAALRAWAMGKPAPEPERQGSLL